MAGRATLVISHNLMTARAPTTILVLDEGAVVEHGTHGELLALGGRYASLAAVRASGSSQADPAL